MKKRFGIILLLLFVTSLMLTQDSFAEKKNGVVKTLWRKVLNVFKNPIQELTPQPKPKLESEKKTEPEPKSEPEKPLAEPAEPKKSPWEEITEEEIRERITYMIEISPDAVNFIPELKVKMDKDGKPIEIKYKIDGVSRMLEDLDKETLIKIHNRINNERVRIQTERIQRQLQAARSAQNVVRPPKVYIPPTIPRIPTPPPRPPKIPTPPPIPPRPPRQ